MSVIKSLMIPCVESQYTQEYIANVFWRQDIAKVSSITLIPYIKNSEIYSVAYINIDEWCATESAYNFIQRLKNPNQEARIVHHDDEWWPIQLNTHNNGNIAVGSYTVSFDASYFVKSEIPTAPCTDDESEHICDDEERPIKGLNNDYYTVDEAFEHIWLLNKQLDDAWEEIQSQRETPFLKIEDELLHFENELRIHESVNKSSNVTQRAQQFGMRKFEDEELERLVEEYRSYYSHPACIIPGTEEDRDFIKSLNRREVARNCDEMFV
jgi:hypothetical protein